MVNGKRLAKDKDCTVMYSNNVNEGTVTMTITGKGEYKVRLPERSKFRKILRNLLIIPLSRQKFCSIVCTIQMPEIITTR